jgi:type IV pilus biogenesis protein CpaD/CtpE
MRKMPVRMLVILIAAWSLLSGCADTKQASGDSDSILRKSDSDHEVHGEVGAMYGHSAR